MARRMPWGRLSRGCSRRSFRGGVRRSQGALQGYLGGAERHAQAGKVQLSPLEKAQDFWELLPGAVRESPSHSERRLAPRCVCKGASSIRQSQSRFPLGAAVTDISLVGCYAELLTTLPIGTKVELVLQVADITVNCVARVRTSHPGVGMGMEFETISEANRRALERAIARLSN